MNNPKTITTSKGTASNLSKRNSKTRRHSVYNDISGCSFKYFHTRRLAEMSDLEEETDGADDTFEEA